MPVHQIDRPSHVPERHAMDDKRPTSDYAQDALMLMVRWARGASTPLQTLARTLGHDVGETARRSLAGLSNPRTARTNAAEASATLRKRRHDQEKVDEYLQARLLLSAVDVAVEEEPRQREAGAGP